MCELHAFFLYLFCYGHLTVSVLTTIIEKRVLTHSGFHIPLVTSPMLARRHVPLPVNVHLSLFVTTRMTVSTNLDSSNKRNKPLCMCMCVCG